MQPIAIFEQEVKTDEGGQVQDVRGWVGPEDGIVVKKQDGVSQVEYTHYADYHIQVRGGRLSYWRIVFKDSNGLHVYESKPNGSWPGMELEGSGAIGILRVAQIVNAVMSLAVGYCDSRLEDQKSTA